MTKSIKIRFAGHAACMGEMLYNLFIRKPEEIRNGMTWA